MGVLQISKLQYPENRMGKGFLLGVEDKKSNSTE